MALKNKHLTSEPLIWSICPSARMRRLDDSVTTLPFLYQVMVGGGTALDSHSRVTDFPTSTLTTTGESPLLSLILGGTGKHGGQINTDCQFMRSNEMWKLRRSVCRCRLTKNCEVNVFVRLSSCIHGHTAVLSSVRYFCFQDLQRATTWGNNWTQMLSSICTGNPVYSLIAVPLVAFFLHALC